MRHAGNQAGIERGGQRAAWRVQARRQLGGQGDRLTGFLHNTRAHQLLMRGVAHRKSGGYRKRIDLRRHSLDGFVQGVQVQGGGLLAVVVMAAADALYGHAGKGFGNSGALGHAGIKTHQQNTDRAAVALDHGIGGQGGGD